MTLLGDVAAAPVFATAARTWTWSDVFLAARLWGQWDTVLAATRDADAPEPAVKQAGRDWRVARRLIAGDELKAWLAERRLSVADWNAYIVRAVGERDPSAPPRPDLLWAEGACSGIWDAVAERLASCAAAGEESGRPAARRPPPPEWFGRMPSAADAAAMGIDAGSVAARSEEVWAAESALAALAAAVAASEAPAGAVASHNVDWLRVDCDWLEAGDENVAREAALLARVDGLALDEVARRAGLPLEPRRVYLGDVDSSLQPALMSAAPGDLVGPHVLNGDGAERWMVASVRDKVVPSLDDPDIRTRAEEAAVGAATRRAADRHVTWHERD